MQPWRCVTIVMDYSNVRSSIATLHHTGWIDVYITYTSLCRYSIRPIWVFGGSGCAMFAAITVAMLELHVCFCLFIVHCVPTYVVTIDGYVYVSIVCTLDIVYDHGGECLRL